jgi:hypothetical protein
LNKEIANILFQIYALEYSLKGLQIKTNTIVSKFKFLLIKEKCRMQMIC